MSPLSAVIFALALATGLAAPAGNGTGNKVEELIDAYLGYVKEASAKVGVFRLSDMKDIPVISIIPPVGILLNTVNRTLSGTADYVVSNEMVENNTARYTMQFSNVKMESDYNAIGLFYGRPMSGAGHAELNLNLNVDVAVNFRNVHGSRNASNLQIAKLFMIYTLNGVSSNITGLNVKGLSTQEAEILVNKEVKNIFSLALSAWSVLSSESVKSQVNHALVGLNIDDAINWLKKNTPEPSALDSFMNIESL